MRELGCAKGLIDLGLGRLESVGLRFGMFYVSSYGGLRGYLVSSNACSQSIRPKLFRLSDTTTPRLQAGLSMKKLDPEARSRLVHSIQ